jgi:hypothetical protein
MFAQTHTMKRMAAAMGIAASLAAWAAQPALPFDGRSPDTAEQAKLNSFVDVRSPDTREAAGQAKESSPVAIVDARSPDTRDAAKRPRPSLLVDFRSPDGRDASFRAVPATTIVAIDRSSPDDFHWADFGVGIGVALASMLVLAGLAVGGLMARHKRGHKTSPSTA